MILALLHATARGLIKADARRLLWLYSRSRTPVGPESSRPPSSSWVHREGKSRDLTCCHQDAKIPLGKTMS